MGLNSCHRALKQQMHVCHTTTKISSNFNVDFCFICQFWTDAWRCAYKRNIALNSVRQHSYFITQGNYIGYMFRLLTSHPQAYFANWVTRCYAHIGIPSCLHSWKYIKIISFVSKMWRANLHVERAENLVYRNQLSGVCWGAVYCSIESIFFNHPAYGRILLRMINSLDKRCRENQNTHFMFGNFILKIVPFMR